jgi:UDP-N-acetylglucosamine enolpyruvyl transferase
VSFVVYAFCVLEINRAHEHLEEKLKGVGAQIRRIGEMFLKRPQL